MSRAQTGTQRLKRGSDSDSDSVDSQHAPKICSAPDDSRRTAWTSTTGSRQPEIALKAGVGGAIARHRTYVPIGVKRDYGA